MSFTAKELDTAVLDYGNGYYDNGFMDLFYGELDSLDTKFGKVVKVDSTSADGDGGYMDIIVTVEGTNRLFRKSGRYSSWDGSELDSPLEEVEAYPVAVTRYRKI